MYIYVIQAVRHFFLNKLYQQTNLLYKLTIRKNNNIILKKLTYISCFTCITCRDPPTHPRGCGTCTHYLRKNNYKTCLFCCLQDKINYIHFPIICPNSCKTGFFMSLTSAKKD